MRLFPSASVYLPINMTSYLDHFMIISFGAWISLVIHKPVVASLV